MDDIQQVLHVMMQVALDPQTAAVIVAVIGLNIHFGYTGLLNIGQSAFMLLGAYGFAISVAHGIPMFFAIIIGLLLAFVFALVLGVPTLKLRGDYLAIVTISAAEIIRYVGRSNGVGWLADLTHGALGLNGSAYSTPFINLSFFPKGDADAQILGFDYSDVGGNTTVTRLVGWVIAIALIWFTVRVARGKTSLEGSAKRVATIGLIVVSALLVCFLVPYRKDWTGVNGWWFTAVTWFVVLLSLGLVYLLVNSPWGRALKGVREDEDAMRSLGKNVYAIKMQALVLGGLFGAISGMLYVMPASLQPDSLGRTMTFNCYTALLLGGAATIWGPVLGSMIFFVGRLGIKTAAGIYLATPEYHLNFIKGDRVDQFSFIIVGVALMLLVIFRPQGILGDKRELRFHV
jgi:neutral amino acid transport system permease protein